MNGWRAVARQLAVLAERYSNKGDIKPEQTVVGGDGNQDQEVAE